MLEGLYTESLSLLAQWNSPEYQATLPAALRGVTRISMIHGDATIVDWSEADLVFMNSTCYDDVLLNKLVESSADAMKVGSFAVTFTKQLPSAKWKVRACCRGAVSAAGWLRVQQKRTVASPHRPSPSLPSTCCVYARTLSLPSTRCVYARRCWISALKR